MDTTTNNTRVLVNTFDTLPINKYKIYVSNTTINFANIEYTTTNLNKASKKCNLLSTIWGKVLCRYYTTNTNYTIVYNYCRAEFTGYDLPEVIWDLIKEYAGIYNLPFMSKLVQLSLNNQKQNKLWVNKFIVYLASKGSDRSNYYMGTNFLNNKNYTTKTPLGRICKHMCTHYKSKEAYNTIYSITNQNINGYTTNINPGDTIIYFTKEAEIAAFIRLLETPTNTGKESREFIRFGKVINIFKRQLTVCNNNTVIPSFYRYIITEKIVQNGNNPTIYEEVVNNLAFIVKTLKNNRTYYCIVYKYKNVYEQGTPNTIKNCIAIPFKKGGYNIPIIDTIVNNNYKPSNSWDTKYKNVFLAQDYYNADKRGNRVGSQIPTPEIYINIEQYYIYTWSSGTQFLGRERFTQFCEKVFNDPSINVKKYINM
tara:strand:- start:1089 stop:2363 length:1275 start_codon:yes stop_codon:yes gene_type:complete